MVYDTLQKRTVLGSHAAVILLTTGFYLFMVYAFYRNGLHLFTFNQIWWQNTPGSGDFPFSEGLGFFLIFPAMLFFGLGRLLLPIYALGMIVVLVSGWYRFRWTNRIAWLLIIACATAISISAWTMLGRSIAVWVAD